MPQSVGVVGGSIEPGFSGIVSSPCRAQVEWLVSAIGKRYQQDAVGYAMPTPSGESPVQTSKLQRLLSSDEPVAALKRAAAIV